MAVYRLFRESSFRAGNDCHDDKRLCGRLPRAWSRRWRSTRGRRRRQKGHRVCATRRAGPGAAARPCAASVSALTTAQGQVTANDPPSGTLKRFIALANSRFSWNVSGPVAFAMQTARVSVAWGGPRNIACLRRGALRSREPRQMSRPKPSCCRWHRFGRG